MAVAKDAIREAIQEVQIADEQEHAMDMDANMEDGGSSSKKKRKHEDDSAGASKKVKPGAPLPLLCSKYN